MRSARPSAGRSWIRKWSAAFGQPESPDRWRAPSPAAGCSVWMKTHPSARSVFAANATGGLNEWPYCGGDEMFFHPGFAARNAVTAVELASLGARASESALDGRAGLFAGLNKTDRIGAVAALLRRAFEILSVYYKPAPACNYAQTATPGRARDGATRWFPERRHRIHRGEGVRRRRQLSWLRLRRTLRRAFSQAKMSIQYCVAATLARGVIEESNYHSLDDPEINRLAGITKLEIDPAFTAAYPGAQGSEVDREIREDGQDHTRLDDVIPATPDQIRARFRAACANWRAHRRNGRYTRPARRRRHLSGGLSD